MVFTNKDLCRILGVVPRQLSHWAEIGLVVPSVNDSKGSGTIRRYNEKDLPKLIVVLGLFNVGIELRVIKNIIDRHWCYIEKLLENNPKYRPRSIILHPVKDGVNLDWQPVGGIVIDLGEVSRRWITAQCREEIDRQHCENARESLSELTRSSRSTVAAEKTKELI